MIDVVYGIMVIVVAVVGVFSFKDIIKHNADEKAYKIRKVKRRARIEYQSQEDARKILFDQWAKGLI